MHSSAKMKVIESVESMQSTCRALARDGKSIRFIPTMGALHDGHGSLIKRAFEDDAHDAHDDDDDDDHEDDANHSAVMDKPKEGTVKVVVVSIFANPIQFNDRNDFANYPNTLESDLELCKRLGVDFVFVPKCEDIYPAVSARPRSSCDRSEQMPVTTSARCIVKPPIELAQILEGRSRGGHFEGMLTIVCKLFNIIQPNRAYFGIKDYQQLVLVTKMTRDLNLPIRICAAETVREAETNLPLSSRNVRLDLDQRRLAAVIMYDTLISTKKCLEDRCRRGNQLRSDCVNGDELDLILIASMMTSQLCLGFGDEVSNTHNNVSNNYSSSTSSPSSSLAQVTVDYFELRCAKDLSTIDYDHNLAIYDCQMGCVRRRSPVGRNPSVILGARLLISILVSKVRLLDNIEVQLNL